MSGNPLAVRYAGQEVPDGAVSIPLCPVAKLSSQTWPFASDKRVRVVDLLLKAAYDCQYFFIVDRVATFSLPAPCYRKSTAIAAQSHSTPRS